jgi:acyl carrier protein
MNIKERLTEIFRNEFENDSLEISNETKADDIPNWDSLANINLVVAVEKEFKIKFNSGDLQSLQNVGDMMNLIQKKLTTS